MMKEEKYKIIEGMADAKVFNWLKRLKELSNAIKNEQNILPLRSEKVDYLLGYIESLDLIL